MFTIGLTGGIGAGKTTVAELFRQRGIVVADADELSRELVAPGTPLSQTLRDHFGDDFFDENGELNRRQLRSYVFEHAHERSWLEAKLHPPIRAGLYQRCNEADSPYAIAVIPLLTKRQTYPWLKRVLVVDATPELQLSRTAERDAVSLEKAEQMMRAQPSAQSRLAMADDVLENNGDLAALEQAVEHFHQQYLMYSQKVS
jgi:dephospho-CoA kinase